jgi:hypothetical protein
MPPRFGCRERCLPDVVEAEHLEAAVRRALQRPGF